jgi:hypothetical protein
MMARVGLGMVTYQAPDKIVQSAFTVPADRIDELVIVNDGSPYPDHCYPPGARVITHDRNQSVGRAKNTALRYLLDRDCEHLFLMEDDVLIRDPSVCEAYVAVSLRTGVRHFNYGLQGPVNLKLKWMDAVKLRLPWRDSSERTFDERQVTPKPRAIARYTDGTELALNAGCIGAFSYYHRSVIERVGLMDETYVNALEHIDHTYRIILAGMHPPYGWFADLVQVNRWLGNIPRCMERSTIARDPKWHERQGAAVTHFVAKHGVHPDVLQRRAGWVMQPVRESLQSILDSYAQEPAAAGGVRLRVGEIDVHDKRLRVVTSLRRVASE